MGEEIQKVQIRQTVEEHLKKELKYNRKGIKVLSLFFIDKVANYRQYDEYGNPVKGRIAEWFEEAYTDLVSKPAYKGVLPYAAAEVHDGYFSADRKQGKVVELKDTSGNTKADEDTYNLIMKDKERLLSMDVPLRFIFSHSALKEGWDNPNIFQICSLREMGAERERRQTLGRGLRLPVNQDGSRVFDDSINRLTVIANESFEEYARGLQADIEQDCNIKFGRIEKIVFAKIVDETTGETIGQDKSERIWSALLEKEYIDKNGDITDNFDPKKEGFELKLPEEFVPIRAGITDEVKRHIFKNRIVNSRERRDVKYNKHIELNEDFKALWEKISKKTRYSVEFETDSLVKSAASNIATMNAISPTRILLDKTEVDITEAGIEGGNVLFTKTETVKANFVLPDILALLQRETELTRSTLVEILKRSGRIKDFKVNPQAFMTEAAKQINRALHKMVVDGIKYECIEGQYYEMRLFEEAEVQEYLSRLYKVKNKENTPYNYISYDSELEHEIAKKLDSNENVKFFCKLPRGFVVPTPVGNYNPDWAVVTEYDEKLYLVRETKSTHDRDGRRETENRKVRLRQSPF